MKLVIVFSVPFILTGSLYAQEKVWPVLMMSSGAGNTRVKAMRRTEAWQLRAACPPPHLPISAIELTLSRSWRSPVSRCYRIML